MAINWPYVYQWDTTCNNPKISSFSVSWPYLEMVQILVVSKYNVIVIEGMTPLGCRLFFLRVMMNIPSKATQHSKK